MIVPKMALYFLAGVATSPDFMDEARLRLGDRYGQAGWQVESRLLFPYGDWSRSLLRQLYELQRDLRCPPHRLQHSIGGQRAAAAVREAYPELPGELLLLGHSGGGTAAVHAAAILLQAHPGLGGRLHVAQIGSPRSRIPAELRGRTLFIRSVDSRERPQDPVTRLGRWSGWERGSAMLPRWSGSLHAPGGIVQLPLAGRHADYFRSGPAYAGADGVTNLEHTLGAVWDWHHAKMRDR